MLHFVVKNEESHVDPKRIGMEFEEVGVRINSAPVAQLERAADF
jgi:uncharacterized protein YdhG (YjbR/CyaY superfamily)